MHSSGPPAPPPGHDRAGAPRYGPPNGPPGAASASHAPAPAARHAGKATRSHRRLVWTIVYAAAPVVLLLGTIAVTGGFAGEGPGPDVVAVGKPVDQVRFSSTVLGAGWERHKLLGKAHRYMVARIRVTNTSDRSVALNDYAQSVIPLQAWGGSVLQKYEAATGGTETQTLQPGVPTDVSFQLTPDTGQEHARSPNLRFCQWENHDDFFYGHRYWLRDCKNWYGIYLKDAERKRNAYNPEGIAAQVNIRLKGGA